MVSLHKDIFKTVFAYFRVSNCSKNIDLTDAQDNSFDQFNSADTTWPHPQLFKDLANIGYNASKHL